MKMDEMMEMMPCPYATVEDLHKRRRQMRGMVGWGYACEPRLGDAEFVAEWHAKYAAASAKRKKLGLPEPVAPTPTKDPPKKRGKKPRPRMVELPPPEKRLTIDEMMRGAGDDDDD